MGRRTSGPTQEPDREHSIPVGHARIVQLAGGTNNLDRFVREVSLRLCAWAVPPGEELDMMRERLDQLMREAPSAATVASGTPNACTSRVECVVVLLNPQPRRRMTPSTPSSRPFGGWRRMRFQAWSRSVRAEAPASGPPRMHSDLRVALLRDSLQPDAEIWRAVRRVYPERSRAIYIRA